MSTLQRIDDFLGSKRLAMIGVSREPKDFSRGLLREFQRRGYEVVPVNPNAAEIEGARSFARVQDIRPPVDSALLMTTPAATDGAVRDCVEAGVKRVWMYRGAGPGAVSRTAVEFCEANGISVVPGYCPYMFWNDSGFVHRLHGFVLKLIGRYPR